MERKRKMQKAIKTIQKNFRAYLRRMYSTAAARARKALEKLYYQAVTTINRTARGRLARRRFITEKYLLEIKNSHVVLLNHALKKRKNGRTVFWYKRKDEVNLLYENYITLCSRTGFQPPRMAVEENIKEIYTRIVARKYELVTIIQKRWRGLMCRRIVIYFKSELIRLRQFIYSRVMKIQRAYRGFIGRLLVRKLFAKSQRDKMMKEYNIMQVFL
jgi:hypothetical protein